MSSTVMPPRRMTSAFRSSNCSWNVLRVSGSPFVMTTGASSFHRVNIGLPVGVSFPLFPSCSCFVHLIDRDAPSIFRTVPLDMDATFVKHEEARSRMHRRHRLVRLLTAVAVATGVVAAADIGTAGAQKAKQLSNATLNGSGSTFVQGYLDACRESFKQLQPNVTVNYPNPGGGSGKGRQDFADQVTQWGATDGPYPAADLSKIKGGTFLYVPTVSAPITVSYNVSSVSRPLKFTAATLAKIFQGDVTTWNDRAIAADNAGVKLPSTKITIARRSDSSGTTQSFTGYLAKAAGSVWKLGSGSTVTWPDGSQGGNGNPGVSSIVKSTDGAIGYVDYSDAVASGLKFGSVQNATGKFIAPTVKAATSALEGVSLAADGLY